MKNAFWFRRYPHGSWITACVLVFAMLCITACQECENRAECIGIGAEFDDSDCTCRCSPDYLGADCNILLQELSGRYSLTDSRDGSISEAAVSYQDGSLHINGVPGKSGCFNWGPRLSFFDDGAKAQFALQNAFMDTNGFTHEAGNVLTITRSGGSTLLDYTFSEGNISGEVADFLCVNGTWSTSDCACKCESGWGSANCDSILGVFACGRFLDGVYSVVDSCSVTKPGQAPSDTTFEYIVNVEVESSGNMLVINLGNRGGTSNVLIDDTESCRFFMPAATLVDLNAFLQVRDGRVSAEDPLNLILEYELEDNSPDNEALYDCRCFLTKL